MLQASLGHTDSRATEIYPHPTTAMAAEVMDAVQSSLSTVIYG